jgi:hypothetical protein
MVAAANVAPCFHGLHEEGLIAFSRALDLADENMPRSARRETQQAVCRAGRLSRAGERR